MAVLLVVLTLIVAAAPGCALTDETVADDRPSAPGEAVVVEVVDGDTVDVELGGDRERVRLIGIDTPESVDPRRPVECFGVEASEHLAALVPAGTAVRLERDVEPRDDFGRLLAYVFRQSDGLFVNLALLEEGYAAALTRPPNIAYTDRFVAATDNARTNGRGLWSACPDEAGAAKTDAVASSRGDPRRASGVPP